VVENVLPPKDSLSQPSVPSALPSALDGSPTVRAPYSGNCFDPQLGVNRSLRELADLKFALDQAAIVAITDPEGLITYVNDAFVRISGFRREELLGKTHRIINSGYHPPEFFANMWSTISRGRVWKGEVRNRRKDGSHYWVDTTIVPFLDEQCQPWQYVSIRYEITDRKRIESEIRSLNEALERRVLDRTAALEEANRELSGTLNRLRESERIRNAFVSALTHDLRTPLVAQMRALELLENYKDLLPPRQAQLIHRLLGSTENLLSMVNQLLDAYALEAGGVQINCGPVDVARLLSDCLDELGSLAENRNIQFVKSFPQSLPDISLDKNLFRRVLMNLLGNALTHCPGGTKVRIHAQVSEDTLSLEIADDGPGIAPELLPHLFEHYSMWERTRKKIGTGLGLFICHEIISRHGGHIRADSQLGQGTRFVISLPRFQQHGAPRPAAPTDASVLHSTTRIEETESP
jgi:PAS domain S-box-containing protein